MTTNATGTIEWFTAPRAPLTDDLRRQAESLFGEGLSPRKSRGGSICPTPRRHMRGGSGLNDGKGLKVKRDPGPFAIRVWKFDHWVYVGHLYAQRKDAKGWVPFVRKIWGGMKTEVVSKREAEREKEAVNL